MLLDMGVVGIMGVVCGYCVLGMGSIENTENSWKTGPSKFVLKPCFSYVKTRYHFHVVIDATIFFIIVH